MRRIGLWGGAAALVACGVIGFLHTSVGRSMLGAGCPFAADKHPVSPRERDARRAKATARLAGAGDAPVRPSAGFVLGRTTRDELVATAARQGLQCGPGRDKTGLSCVEPARPDHHIAADFAFDGTLVSLLRTRYFASAAAARAALEVEVDRLVAAVGQPSRQNARAPLDGGVLRQDRVEFRRRNYYASLSATNFGGRYMVSEVFRAP